MSSLGTNWILRPKKHTLTRSQAHRATPSCHPVSIFLTDKESQMLCQQRTHLDPKILEVGEEGSPSILQFMPNEAALGTVCRERGCMERKPWESLQSPPDCNIEFWMAEGLSGIRSAKCRDAHVLVLATHWWQPWFWMRHSTASKMHTLARSTALIHSLELAYVFPDSALNSYQQDQ